MKINKTPQGLEIIVEHIDEIIVLDWIESYARVQAKRNEEARSR